MRKVLEVPRRVSRRDLSGVCGSTGRGRGALLSRLNHLQGLDTDLGSNPGQIGPGGCVDSGALGSGTAYPPARDSHDHIGVLRASAHERPTTVPLPEGHGSHSLLSQEPLLPVAQEGHRLWADNFCSHTVFSSQKRSWLWWRVHWDVTGVATEGFLPGRRR